METHTKKNNGKKQIEKLNIIPGEEEQETDTHSGRERKSACKVAPFLGETLVLFHQNKYQYEHYKSIEQYIT